jgi:Bifunctional DNA primase/polymerase, N-terminal/Primase C terminal 1 (PriCT-1)
MQNVSRKGYSVNNDTSDIESLSQQLFNHLDEVSWKTERNLAKELKVRADKIRPAKDYLEEHHKIVIRYYRNGNRPNPRHEITKISKSGVQSNSIYGLAVLSLWNELDRLSLIELYMKSGWSILPFHNKQPAVENVKAWLARYKSIEQVLAYFDQHPELNVGMKVQGLTVVDLDCQEIPEYFCRAGNFMDTLTAKTGKGYHFYFQRDPVVRTSTKILDKSTDTRCDGSFIVLPSSAHESGFVYSWHNLSPVQALPIQIRRLWRENNFKAQQSDREFILPYAILQGTRNDTLFRFGRSLRKQGLSLEEINCELSHINHTRCNPTLSYPELRRLLHHIWTYPDRA